MCGIVGAVTEREVAAILLEGLKRLEYRGYDSAGMAVLTGTNQRSIHRLRRKGKVSALEAALGNELLQGKIGVAHTRWATHGMPSEDNAHPHLSNDTIAIVHNGIIENYELLRRELIASGYHFKSETDTEVIAHLIHQVSQASSDFLSIVKQVINKLTGAFAIAVLHADNPDVIVVARRGSPLVIGVGIGENFVASDQLALLHVTDRFIILEEGDLAEISAKNITINDINDNVIERPIITFEHGVDTTDKGFYRHYMLKEIFEQPRVIHASFENRIDDKTILESAFGRKVTGLLEKTEVVHIVACGTSFHAGLIACYWIEQLVGIPCRVEVASEFRYRQTIVQPNTLFITISQSGETADTLAALRSAKQKKYLGSLTICNVPSSSLVRESDAAMLTMAGPEIGVASTKAFSTQLVVLLLFTLLLRQKKNLSDQSVQPIIQGLNDLPNLYDQVLAFDEKIKLLAEDFAEKHHTLFLGRGTQYPIAMEGALKLKEISYIHAEAYPAGELKHGPLALVDKDMPVVVVAPNNELVAKLKANLHEVRARGGELIVFADASAGVTAGDGCKVITLPTVHDVLAPILYVLPLQLLAYHVAVLKGTDVDQPRNLAKSVTVE